MVDVRINQTQRDRIVIVMAVVTRIQERGAVKRTRLMYVCNISWTVLKEILEYCVASGFIRYDGGSPLLVSLTEKGRRLLSVWKQLDELLGGIDLGMIT